MNVFGMVRSEGSSQVTWLYSAVNVPGRVWSQKMDQGNFGVASLLHSCKFVTLLSRLGSEVAKS